MVCVQWLWCFSLAATVLDTLKISLFAAFGMAFSALARILYAIRQERTFDRFDAADQTRLMMYPSPQAWP